MKDPYPQPPTRFIKSIPCHRLEDGRYGFFNNDRDYRCPYGAPGDRLWVRESWAVQDSFDQVKPKDLPNWVNVHYAATERTSNQLRWRPSIHMPRMASRIALEITNVRAERLQVINDEDAMDEGVTPQLRSSMGYACEESAETFAVSQARDTYRKLWDFLHGPASWQKNPWVWVVEFRRW